MLNLANKLRPLLQTSFATPTLQASEQHQQPKHVEQTHIAKAHDHTFQPPPHTNDMIVLKKFVYQKALSV